MNRSLVALSMAVALAACVDSDVSAGPSRLAPYLAPAGDLTTQIVPDEYIVVLRDDAGDVAMAAASADRLGAEVSARWERALRGFAMRASPAVVRALRQDGRVQFVEANGLMTIDATQAPTPSWGLDRIDQQDLPLNNSYTYPNTGTGVHVYIIDTGILLMHNEFTGRLGAGFDVVTPGGTANDCNGHGTHVAGIAGGTTFGVAKAVTLHPVRTFDCTGGGSTADVISAINWVAVNRIAPAVANMSLGGLLSVALNNATTALVAANVTTTVASGKSASDACNYSPGSTPNAITVNAVNKLGNSAGYTNFGPCTDIYAPGTNIISAWITSNAATNTLSGTSMAAPHVAGAAALYLNANPAATPAQVAAALINNAALNKVGSVPANTPNKLLSIQFIGTGPVNHPPVANFTTSCQSASPQSCTLNAASSTDDGGFANLTFTWTNTVGRPTKTGTTAKYQFSVTYPNTFDVTLTARDAQGLKSTRTSTVTIPGSILFQDNFNVRGTKLNLAAWTTEIGQGSFLGRTQLADWVTPGGVGQFVVGTTGAQLALQTYNPTGFSLYGTHGKTLATFQPTATSGVSLTGRLQLTSLQRGLVYGVYFYSCIPPTCAFHDEIDIELVTNLLQPGSPLQVQHNRYAAEAFGAGNGGLVNLPAGFDPLAVHDWTIRWSFSRIEYLVDGQLLYSATTKVPQGPMNATVIAWGPSSGWPTAYDPSLQPVVSPVQNQSFVALLTSIVVSAW